MTDYEAMLELCGLMHQTHAPAGRTLRPAIPITDPRFRYVNSANTDIRQTFARARRELAGATVINLKRSPKAS